jgi:hypothetical protein
MTTAWGSLSTSPAVDAGFSDGDITTVLKRVREHYIAKAAEFEAKAFGENAEEFRRVQLYYAKQADIVVGLIDQESL